MRDELVDVGGKIGDLEGSLPAAVRERGQSLRVADGNTYRHCRRVAMYSVAVGRVLGLDRNQLAALGAAAYLHDLGKMRIPREILTKPGRLTAREFVSVRMHPLWGLELLGGVDLPWDLKPIIRWHHEKYDGTGYPDALEGEQIPLAAQVVCIADVYDAYTSARSYKAAGTPEEAVRRVAALAHWWRRDVYRAFLEAVGRPEILRHRAAGRGRPTADQPRPRLMSKLAA